MPVEDTSSKRLEVVQQGIVPNFIVLQTLYSELAVSNNINSAARCGWLTAGVHYRTILQMW